MTMRLELKSNEEQDHQLAATASELDTRADTATDTATATDTDRYMLGIECVYLLCGPCGSFVFIFWFWQCGQNIVYANNAGEGTAHSQSPETWLEMSNTLK